MIRFFLLVIISMGFILNVVAQQHLFIYVESETKEPFYVLIDGKTNYSSSINGFLTIPQLTSGVYDAEIGFVKNKYPEQHFLISIDKQDIGFLLRKLRDSSFGLLNLQTFATISANGRKATEEVVPNKIVSPAAKKAASSGSSNSDSPFANKIANKPDQCVIATEGDFLVLRRHMAAAITEEEMIGIAEKTFAEKCFSTEQVKNLSLLILTDINKVSFFLTARKNIYDLGNFASLQSQLSSPAAIKQFRNAL